MHDTMLKTSESRKANLRMNSGNNIEAGLNGKGAWNGGVQGVVDVDRGERVGNLKSVAESILEVEDLPKWNVVRANYN